MFRTTFLDLIPLWAIFVGSAMLVVASIETGFRIGSWRARRTKKSDLPHTGGSVAATLGLLAFMLAFTFGSTTSRWDERKGLVLEEANAVSTAYLRADILPEAQRDKVRQLIAEYLDLTAVAVAKSKEPGLKQVASLARFERTVESLLAELQDFQSRLWDEAMAAYQAQPTAGTNLFISAINDMFDIQQSRVTKAFDQRMPMVFWITLYVLAALSMALSGYDAGLARGGRTQAPWVVAFAFSSVLLLVWARDRPQTSSVNKAPLLDLQRVISSGQLG